MKNTRRIISVLIAVVLVMGLFSAVAFADNDRNDNGRNFRGERNNDNKKDVTIKVNVLWHDNDYGDWKNYRPSYLIFMLEAYDKQGGWTQAVTCNAASFGFRWQPNWSFTQTAKIPQWYIDNSAYILSGPVNAPAGYTFNIVTTSATTWTVTAKLDPATVKTTTTKTNNVPLVPVAGF